jgi:glutamate racemase
MNSRNESPSRNDRPIGLFDSGLGGLTVVKAVRAAMPNENLVFLGDTARVPYGTRSSDTVIRYALACAERLMDYDVKFVVVACNTVSAAALPALRRALPVPVLGVIEAGARSGWAASTRGRVGVIATQSTVASGAYQRALTALDARAHVAVNPAPLLVPLVEEGWLDGPVPRLAVERYLQPLIDQGIDSLVLGCTHYPLLRSVIEGVLAERAAQRVAVVDGAAATSDELRLHLEDSGLARRPEAQGALRILVTDLPTAFANAAARFLEAPLEGVPVEQIDITVGRHLQQPELVVAPA